MKFPKAFIQKIKNIEPIIKSVQAAQATAYLVGGSVRDLVLGREIKDIDIEVHGIGVDELEEVLQQFGTVSRIGKQFGVLRLHHLDIDWSLPRRDSKGRKPSVIVDPDMTIEEACRRRDLTMNAMAIDLAELCRQDERQAVIDPFGGLEDIKNKRLRAVDAKLFAQDPLRFYRVMQFISRFDFQPDEKLNQICATMDLTPVCQGGELARERIYEEIKKMCLKSERPSLGWRWLHKVDRLSELFPELGALVGVKQRHDYHPEGDVFEHTMQTFDASTTLPVELSDDEKFIIMLGALCHDFGKALKTDDDGHSRGHDEAGVAPAKAFLHRFTRDSFLIRSVCKLVRYHRMPLVLIEQKSSLKAYKRLAAKLAPEVDFQKLYLVAWCDVRGRSPKGHTPLKVGFKTSDQLLKAFLENVTQAKVEKGPEEPVLHGRDLLAVVEPGPEMGRLLKLAYTIQIDEGITDSDELKKRVLK